MVPPGKVKVQGILVKRGEEEKEILPLIQRASEDKEYNSIKARRVLKFLSQSEKDEILKNKKENRAFKVKLKAEIKALAQEKIKVKLKKEENAADFKKSSIFNALTGNKINLDQKKTSPIFRTVDDFLTSPIESDDAMGYVDAYLFDKYKADLIRKKKLKLEKLELLS